MVKNKINCAVLISGRGTNLKSIFKYSKTKKSKINLNLVLSDKLKAKGLIFARKNKIKTIVINYKNKMDAENQIIKYLRKYNIKLICLAGFMRILSKKILKIYKNKIINIHPSLLPKYKGLNTHERAIKHKEKFSGCTVHYVNEKLDSGKIIFKQSVKILKKDDPKMLAKKILRVENNIYPKAIHKILSRI